jgi:hypothetical protein
MRPLALSRAHRALSCVARAGKVVAPALIAASVVAAAVTGPAAGSAPATALTAAQNVSATSTTAAVTATSTTPSLPMAGLYAGPGARTTGAADAFAKWSGVRLGTLLDFPPEASWTGHTGLTGPSWLLEAHRSRPERLEYSLPMLPSVAGTSLAACAAGSYDTYWAQTGRNLVAYGQGDAVVRPGWEMNANWYRWSATGRTTEYIGCFRRIVTTMRATKGASFRFDWNVNLGSSPFPAEKAYPGDAYVDYVGVDVYDTSWTWYPTPTGTTLATARDNAWKWILKGDHGLVFWRDFAVAHGKRLAVPEWGLTTRTDGHGGGDNPVFVSNMLKFMADPANRVAYWHYFNFDAGSVKHNMTSATTAFAKGGATFRSLAPALTAR